MHPQVDAGEANQHHQQDGDDPQPGLAERGRDDTPHDDRRLGVPAGQPVPLGVVQLHRRVEFERARVSEQVLEPGVGVGREEKGKCQARPHRKVHTPKDQREKYEEKFLIAHKGDGLKDRVERRAVHQLNSVNGVNSPLPYGFHRYLLTVNLSYFLNNLG